MTHSSFIQTRIKLNVMKIKLQMHQARVKRSTIPADIESSLHTVFIHTDENHDGHITVDEIIDSVVGSTGLKINNKMRQGFNVVFGNPQYDLNENGSLEENGMNSLTLEQYRHRIGVRFMCILSV